MFIAELALAPLCSPEKIHFPSTQLINNQGPTPNGEVPGQSLAKEFRTAQTSLSVRLLERWKRETV